MTALGESSRSSDIVCATATDPKQPLEENMFFHIFRGLLVALLLLHVACEEESTMTDWEVPEMFDSISENTDWDMSGDMLWGYFFTDSDKSALERAAPALEDMGYLVRSVYLSDKESADEPDLWWLHVEKVETHSVESLEETNLMLYEFAKKHDLDSYDGMDVGPVFDTG